MKLAIVGSRSFKEESWVWQQIDKFIKDQTFDSPVILSGGASGVDDFAERYAKHRGFDHVVFLPYFKVDRSAKFAPAHFFSRNKQMIDNADKVLAIWDGESRGTAMSIDYAKNRGKTVMVIEK